MDVTDTRKLIEEILSLNPLFRKIFFRPMKTSPIPGITPTQMHAIFALATHNNLNMTQLSEELSVSKQQLTKIIDVLFEKDYVQRFSDEKNRRLVLLRLTDSGYHFIDEMTNVVVDDLFPRFDLLTNDEKAALMQSAITIKNIMGKLEKLDGKY